MELSIEQGSVEGKTRMNTGIKTRGCIFDGKLINKFNWNKELLLDLVLTHELSHDPSDVMYVYMHVHSYIIINVLWFGKLIVPSKFFKCLLTEQKG